MRLRYLWLILMLIVLKSAGTGQQDLSIEDYQEVSEDYRYDGTKLGLTPRKFSENPKKEEPKQIKPPNKKDFDLPSIFPTMLISIIVIAIVALLLSEYKKNKTKNKAPKKIVPMSNKISDIDQIDPEFELKAALSTGDYRLAIRMQFIRYLKQLQRSKKIIWQNEKTNRDYYHELQDSEDKIQFKELSRIYEKVWYGSESIDLPTYEQANLPYLNNRTS